LSLELKFGDIRVGPHAVHKIFGLGTIDEMHAVSSNYQFSLRVGFATGDTTGPGAVIRTESIAAEGA